jgi:hypothetical protein
MVIISTSATEVSIQAVSPEFGVHDCCTLLSQAGGVSAAGAAVAGAVAAGAVAGACAKEEVEIDTLAITLRIKPQRSAASPRRRRFPKVIVKLLSGK